MELTKLTHLAHNITRQCLMLMDLPAFEPFEKLAEHEVTWAVSNVACLLNDLSQHPQIVHESVWGEYERAGWKPGPKYRCEKEQKLGPNGEVLSEVMKKENPLCCPYEALPKAYRNGHRLLCSVAAYLSQLGV